MANRFWVVSSVSTTYSGNINDTNHWSTTSGGVGGSALPTAADDVFFDGVGSLIGDKTITLNAAQSWRSFDMTGGGVAGIIIAHNAGVTITIGAASSTGCKFEAGGTYTAASTTTSGIQFTNTGSVTKDFTSAGYTFGIIFTANNGGSNWRHADDFTGATVAPAAGVWSTNGKTLTLSSQFGSNNGNTRTINITNSTINISSVTGTPWTFQNASGLTFVSTGSTINITGNATTVKTIFFGGQTYNNVVISGSNTGAITGIVSMVGSTFANYTRTSPASTVVTTDWIAGNFTVSTMLTLQGNSVSERLGILGSPLGTGATITAAAVTLANVDFQGITGAGAAAPFTGTSLSDCTSNSGITFDAPRTLYWVGGAGSFSNTAHWSLSSGGAGGQAAPLVQDTQMFDNTGLAAPGNIIQFDLLRSGKQDWSAVTVNGPLYHSDRGVMKMYADFYAWPAFVQFALDNASFSWENSTGTALLKYYGVLNGSSTTINCVGGTVQLYADALYPSVVYHTTFAHTGGTLDCSTYNPNIFVQSTFGSTGAFIRTLNMGSGIWQFINANVTVFTLAGTNLTLNAGSSTIQLGAASGTQSISAVGYTLGNLSVNQASTRLEYLNNAGTGQTFSPQFQGNSGGGAIITGATTWSDIHLYVGAAAYSFTTPASITTTVTTFEAVGAVGKLISLLSSTGGTPATLSKSSGTVNGVDWVSIKDSAATGGAAFYAGANSTNVSGNTGWIFTAVPVVTTSSSGVRRLRAYQDGEDKQAYYREVQRREALQVQQIRLAELQQQQQEIEAKRALDEAQRQEAQVRRPKTKAAEPDSGLDGRIASLSGELAALNSAIIDTRVEIARLDAIEAHEALLAEQAMDDETILVLAASI